MIKSFYNCLFTKENVMNYILSAIKCGSIPFVIYYYEYAFRNYEVLATR